MAKYYQRLCGLVRKAITEYGLIHDGDRVAVGVSGGKDSVILTLALADLKKYIGIDFDVVGVTVDPRFFSKTTDYSRIARLFESRGIEYHTEITDIGPVVFDIRKEDSPCSLCSRMRRGALLKAARQYGCNRLALGHHFDDAIETFYMNLWNEGRIGTFSPDIFMEDNGMHVIRPMCLATENEVLRAVKETGAPIIKSVCPQDGRTNRRELKEFISQKCRTDSHFREKHLNAFQKSGIDGWAPKRK